MNYAEIPAKNKIILDTENVGTFIGKLAATYSFVMTRRHRLDQLFEAANSEALSPNKFFVLDGVTLRAAQTTIEGAMQYMADDRVLVICE